MYDYIKATTEAEMSENVYCQLHMRRRILPELTFLRLFYLDLWNGHTDR